MLPTLKLVVTLMFVSAAVSLPERSARLQRLFVGIAVLGLLTAVPLALALVPIDVRMRVLMWCVFLPHLLALATLVWAWRRGDRFAPWLMVGFAPVLLAATCISACIMGWLPVSFSTTHVAQIGSAIELPS